MQLIKDSVDFKFVKDKLVIILKELISDEKYNSIVDFFEDEISLEKKSINKWSDEEIAIDVDTVYKVKGETHTATLYLETETMNGSDLKRIMPLFVGKKMVGKSELYEKSRRVAYVGMSRPTHMLCVAMQVKTYEGNENAFVNWDVITLNKL